MLDFMIPAEDGEICAVKIGSVVGDQLLLHAEMPKQLEKCVASWSGGRCRQRNCAGVIRLSIDNQIRVSIDVHSLSLSILRSCKFYMYFAIYVSDTFTDPELLVS